MLVCLFFDCFYAPYSFKEFGNKSIAGRCEKLLFPAKEAPKGMMTNKRFEQIYPLNSVVKGIYIPYTEMKSARHGTIRTKNGKKYHFAYKRPRKVGQEIRSHLVTFYKPFMNASTLDFGIIVLFALSLIDSNFPSLM